MVAADTSSAAAAGKPFAVAAGTRIAALVVQDRALDTVAARFARTAAAVAAAADHTRQDLPAAAGAANAAAAAAHSTAVSAKALQLAPADAVSAQAEQQAQVLDHHLSFPTAAQPFAPCAPVDSTGVDFARATAEQLVDAPCWLARSW